jgi:arsenite methyltransferase
MEQAKTITAIDKRYSALAGSTCCLSCGKAIDLAEPMPGESFVDLGSGRGTEVIRLAQKVGPDGFAYGIDVSEGMIDGSRSLAERLGIANAEFVRAELGSLPIQTGSIDCVISNCTINHASDKLAVWREIGRVLKKGGRFVVSDIYSIAPVPPEFANDPAAIAECWAGAVTKPEYLTQILQAGLSISKIAEESAPYKKGQIEVSSFSVIGYKAGCCCSV